MIYQRLIIALAAALALSVGGHAQMAPWQPRVLIPAPSGYTGPGDVVSGATVWYGLRAYNAAYATGSNNAVNVRRASDNTTTNIVILANGNLDTATAASFAGTDATCTGTISSTTLTISSCASGTLHVNDPISGTGINAPAYITAIGTCGAPPGTCTLNASQTVSVGETITAQVALFVATLYDQSGNGKNATQATTADQPQLLPACLSSGTLPCIEFLGSATQRLVATITTVTQPYSASCASFNSTVAGTKSCFGSAGFLGGYNSTNAEIFAGTLAPFAGAAQTAYHNIQFLFNSTTSIINLDGTDSGSLSAGTAATSTSLSVGSANTTDYLTGPWLEFGLWPLAFTSGNRTSLCHNQYAYWGGATSC